MAASKPEVVITQLLDKIATPFQRLPPIFGVQQPNGTIVNSARCNRKSVLPGHQTGSSYISAYRQYINSAIGLLDPENGVLAVGTALIFCLEAEI